MGTLGTGILENDAAMDAYYGYLDRYNEGMSTENIRQKFEQDHRSLFAESVLHDASNFWLGLALAQWECGALDADVLANIRRIVTEDIDHEYWDDGYAPRKKVLQKFLKKIEQPRKAPRKPVKPRLFSAPFKKGNCLVFQYPDSGHYGGYLCLGASQGQQKIASNVLATLRLRQENKPTVADFLRSHVMCRSYGEYKGTICRFSQDPEPEISARALSKNVASEPIWAMEVIGNIPVEKSFGKVVYGTRFWWGVTDMTHQYQWEEAHPESVILAFPVDEFIRLPIDPELAKLGEYFAQSQHELPWEEYQHWCQQFQQQLAKVGWHTQREKVYAFVAAYAGCSHERAINRVDNVMRWY